MALILNDVVMEKSVILDPNGISSSNIVDTMIVVNNEMFFRAMIEMYRDGNASLIPLNEVSSEIQSARFREHHHVYVINSVLELINPQDFLIDKDFIHEVELMELESSSGTKPLKILVVRIFTKRYVGV